MGIEGRGADVPSTRCRPSSAVRPLALAFAVGFGLAGCAASPGATATCTDLISAGGGLLKFCQAGDKLHVSESGIDPEKAGTDVRIVDDPAVLDALGRQVGPLPDFQASRRLIAHACVVKGGDFVTLSLADLKRIVGTPVRAAAAVAEADTVDRP